MKKGEKFWCWWLHRYLYYSGKAYNAKDYEFVDICDELFVLNADEVEKLEKR